MSGPSARRVRHPLRARVLEVRRVERVTPSRRRIVLSGDLADFCSDSPDDHVKLIFPDAPGQAPRLPEVGEDRVSYPAGVAKPPMRDYTPYLFDQAAGELVIEFVLHGDGPAATWAAAARPGDLVGQVGPRGSFVVDGARRWVIAGDESALPAIARRLRELPAHAVGTVLIEVADAGERLPLTAPAGLDVHWLIRDVGDDLLADAVRALPPFEEGTFVWAGAEAGVAARFRAHLRDERGHAGEYMRVTGYWRLGVADHHDGPASGSAIRRAGRSTPMKRRGAPGCCSPGPLVVAITVRPRGAAGPVVRCYRVTRSTRVCVLRTPPFGARTTFTRTLAFFGRLAR